MRAPPSIPIHNEGTEVLTLVLEPEADPVEIEPGGSCTIQFSLGDRAVTDSDADLWIAIDGNTVRVNCMRDKTVLLKPAS